ncbi:CatB-related O-acetyltransferase [Clostridium perfringens]|uniref:CatB-related O-acetyltransferase n=1 Tax=Clostridium perfringens TaxID=1502 RepID=UPI0037543276
MNKIKYLFSKALKKILRPSSIKECNIDRTSRICSEGNIIKCNIGRYSYIGNRCTVVNTDIGSFSSIADGCQIGNASHPINWVSTSPVFHCGKNIMKKNYSNHKFDIYNKTVIENDVWIGANTLIKSGVKIGNGAIIGMGSVVTKNVPPYEIWAGNPAKCIRKRFDDDIIEKLLLIKWWEYSEEKLTKESESFNNIELFIKHK